MLHQHFSTPNALPSWDYFSRGAPFATIPLGAPEGRYRVETGRRDRRENERGPAENP